jgi:hypothetical protein
MVFSSTQLSVQWALCTLPLGVTAAKSDQLSLKIRTKIEHMMERKASATTALENVANNNRMQEKIIKIIHYTGRAHFRLSFTPPSVEILHFLAPGTSNHNGLPNRNHEIKKIMIIY